MKILLASFFNFDGYTASPLLGAHVIPMFAPLFNHSLHRKTTYTEGLGEEIRRETQQHHLSNLCSEFGPGHFGCFGPGA